MTKRFQAMKSYMTMLRLGFSYQRVATSLSRDVVEILLSRLSLPRDLCWYIFDFLLNTRELRKVLTIPHHQPPKDTKTTNNPGEMVISAPLSVQNTLHGYHQAGSGFYFSVKLLDKTSRRGYASTMIEQIFEFIQAKSEAIHEAVRAGSNRHANVTGTIGETNSK
jgi:hypothetical protein